MHETEDPIKKVCVVLHTTGKNKPITGVQILYAHGLEDAREKIAPFFLLMHILLRALVAKFIFVSSGQARYRIIVSNLRKVGGRVIVSRLITY